MNVADFQCKDKGENALNVNIASSNIEDCEICITGRFIKTEVMFCNYSTDFQVISTSHPCFLGGRESLVFQTYL